MNQKYLDGSSEKSKLAKVNSQLTENVFRIFQVNANQFQVTISAQTTGRTSLMITDAIGKKRLVQQVSLQSGINQVMLPKQGFSTGVYILHGVIDGKKQSVKFLVN
ncbi:MAG: T9SS type A sorting domain-containing protein [Sphingobacteriales bacterium]|nr:MAG: T9SS type A sorting domain-containing protein [Sphingobacteriales bacterium]